VRRDGAGEGKAPPFLTLHVYFFYNCREKEKKREGRGREGGGGRGQCSSLVERRYCPDALLLVHSSQLAPSTRSGEREGRKGKGPSGTRTGGG